MSHGMCAPVVASRRRCAASRCRFTPSRSRLEGPAGSRRPSSMPRSALVFFTVFALTLGSLAAPVRALDAGARLPEIGLTDLRGARVDAASLKGKVVIVDFWASWCAPCKEEMPVLERLYKKYKSRGLVVVGVSVDEELANVKGFVKQLPVSFSIVHDVDHKVAGRFKPPRMPSSAPVRAVKRAQDTLGRLHDLQVLQSHVAAVQAEQPSNRSLPDGGLDVISRALEDECRHLHARYVAAIPKLNEVVDAIRTVVVPQLAHRARTLKMTLKARPAVRRAPARPLARAAGQR